MEWKENSFQSLSAQLRIVWPGMAGNVCVCLCENCMDYRKTFAEWKIFRFNI